MNRLSIRDICYISNLKHWENDPDVFLKNYEDFILDELSSKDCYYNFEIPKDYVNQPKELVILYETSDSAIAMLPSICLRSNY